MRSRLRFGCPTSWDPASVLKWLSHSTSTFLQIVYQGEPISVRLCWNKWASLLSYFGLERANLFLSIIQVSVQLQCLLTQLVLEISYESSVWTSTWFNWIQQSDLHKGGFGWRKSLIFWAAFSNRQPYSELIFASLADQVFLWVTFGLALPYLSAVQMCMFMFFSEVITHMHTAQWGTLEQRTLFSV